MAELPQVPPPRCMHLHSTSLAVHGDAGAMDDQGVMRDAWCIRTGRPLGPDNDGVGLKVCSDPDRGCFQEY